MKIKVKILNSKFSGLQACSGNENMFAVSEVFIKESAWFGLIEEHRRTWAIVQCKKEWDLMDINYYWRPYLIDFTSYEDALEYLNKNLPKDQILPEFLKED